MASKRFAITDEDVKKIEAMAGIGLPLYKIALIFGVDEQTLRLAMKKYGPAAQHAIERGAALGEKNVQQTAYQMATSGQHPAMTIFWLKVRSRWSHAPETIVNQYNVQQNTNAGKLERVLSEQDQDKLLDIMLKLKDEPGDAPCKLIPNSLQQSRQSEVRSSRLVSGTESSDKKSRD